VAGRTGRLLDYGCGDGTFIAMIHNQFQEAVGVDVERGQLDACRARLGHLPGVAFESSSSLADERHAGAWDVVTCMEVLEHCLEPERQRILDALVRLVSPEGCVLISVPIEVGPSVAAKQFFRMAAALRGHGDYQYRERYAPAEMVRAVCGRRVARPSYTVNGYEYYGHKGFDFRDLEREIAERMTIEARFFTPLPPLKSVLNSQVWFLCRPADVRRPGL
jgi:2-polyprenyl-3-methyl-5-hydroxy-6-metoxy-1,4-benzoquinol methylase